MSVYKINTSKLFTKISFGIFFFLVFFFNINIYGQIDGIKHKLTSPDSIRLNTENIKRQEINTDSLHTVKDSLVIKKDSLQESTLTSKLFHYAEDYTEVNEKKKFIKLYNRAHIQYEDIDLQAGVIYVDYAKKEVYAGRIPDSLGKLTQRPVFKQGNTETENDSIRFNFETKKALVWNTYTKEGEFGMHSEITKKYNDSVMFLKNIRFTTSTDKEHPEYYFLSKKAKIVPGKKIVIGPTQMWIEDVATPLFIPFGFFPLTETRSSGFLMPTFGDTRYGYSLSNGGFYWVLGPYLDLTTTGDIYTNGSYSLQIKSNYKKRYRFAGGITYSFQNQITSEIGLPDYEKNTSWKLRWQHHTDGKSNPLNSFSANVDIGSSKYYKNSYNYSDVTNINNRMGNELNSSVTYQKKFANLPVNFSISANHSQNVNTGIIKLTLPDFNLNVNRIYPFSRKGKKSNAFQKINLTYNLKTKNEINTTDDLLFTNEMWEKGKIEAIQNIPVKTDFKIFKYFNVHPEIKYTEVWALQSIEKYWDSNANNGNGGEAIKVNKGFQSFRNLSASTGISTVIYGTYFFGKKHKIQGIRHTISTSLNYSYRPIFEQFIKKYYNPNTDEFVEYTIFDNNSYGKPNTTESKIFNLSLNNNFEAKIKTKDGKSKKINFLNINTGYNFIADSLKLTKPRLNSSAKITDGLQINLNATFDPYALNDEGKNIDKFALINSQGIGRIENFSITTGYNFNNQTFTKKKNNQEKEKKKTETEEAFYNNITWDLNIDYNFYYRNKAYHPTNSYFNEISQHTVSFSGKINFSPSWNISYRSGYDLVKKGFTVTQFTFFRDLKSWKISFTWGPMKPSYWFFNIGIKSSVLQGIKYDKRKEPFKKFF
jgi:lipopolysaccharide assembly outer membrane protein LptD (OstA)